MPMPSEVLVKGINIRRFTVRLCCQPFCISADIYHGYGCAGLQPRDEFKQKYSGCFLKVVATWQPLLSHAKVPWAATQPRSSLELSSETVSASSNGFPSGGSQSLSNVNRPPTMRCSGLGDNVPIAVGMGRLVLYSFRTVAIFFCAYSTSAALMLCLASNAA